MDMLIASAVFLCGIFLCMAMGWSLTIGLAFGLVCFTLAARRRGHSWRALAAMAGDGARTAMVVLRVLVFIGCLTGLWRASGTIALFRLQRPEADHPQHLSAGGLPHGHRHVPHLRQRLRKWRGRRG